MKNIYNYDLLSERVKEEIKGLQYESFLEFYSCDNFKDYYIEGLREKEAIFKNLEISTFDVSYSQSDYINLSGYIMSKDLLNFTKKYRDGILEELNRWSSFPITEEVLDDIVEALEEEENESIDIINLTSRSVKADTYFYEIKKYVEDLFYMIQVELLNDFTNSLDEFVEEEFENYFQDYINNTEFYEDGEECNECNEDIILINNNIKLKIDERVLVNTRMPSHYILEFFEELKYNMERYEIEFTIENIKEQALECLSEFTYNQTPVYNYEIMEQFSNIDACDIDWYCENLGLEYNPRTMHFAEFARIILAERDADVLNEDLQLIFENCEFIEFDDEDRKKIKQDIINHLKNYQDLHIEELAEMYKTQNSLNAVEAINEYISAINYSGWESVGDGPTLKEWDAYKYYYIDLYNDKDIQEAILNY